MPATETAAVRLQGLRKSYGPTEVLKGIDLDVQPGEVITIIGKSGSGKSTLLRCVNGLETFDHGSLLVEGQPLQHGNAPALRALRQRVGMIFQSFNLLPTLSDKLVHALEVRKNFLFEHGYLRGDFSVKDWIDPEPLAAAHKLLESRVVRKAA